VRDIASLIQYVEFVKLSADASLMSVLINFTGIPTLFPKDA